MRPQLQVLRMPLPLWCHGVELAVAAEVPNRIRFVTGMLISHKFYHSTENSAGRSWYVDDQAPCVGVHLLCVLPCMCVRACSHVHVCVLFRARVCVCGRASLYAPACDRVAYCIGM